MPTSLSLRYNRYTEKWLKEYNLNLFYYRAHMAKFELVWGILLAPVILLPVPGQPDVRASEFGTFLQDAAECFAGIGTAPDGTSCFGTWQVWLLWVAVGFVSLFSQLSLIKYGSCVLSSILSAVNGPVTVAYFEWPLLAGTVLQHGLRWNTWVAVAIASAGAFIYGMGKEDSPQRQLQLLSPHEAGDSKGPDVLSDAWPSAYGDPLLPVHQQVEF